MPRVGFELTIPAFERAKTDHVLDRAATEIGTLYTTTSRRNLRTGIRAISVHGQPCILEIVCPLLRNIQFAFHFITLRSIFRNGHVSYQRTY
jgi:hypothetical protein